MAFKIIHLEDSAMKHSTISRAIKSVVSAEIDWVRMRQPVLIKLMTQLVKAIHMI